ncbi:MAG: hemolysin III family protein [Chitinophagales bacterium]|nr:hemolysin III family protein [Chitinophagales bacterium]
MGAYAEAYYKRELANSISHGFGVIFGIIALPVAMALAVRTNSVEYTIGAAIYSTTFLMVFLTSTIYHSIHEIKIKRIFQVLDHISIYFLIAGSYTPFVLLFLNTNPGWTLLIVIWCMVFFGSIWKVFYTDRWKKVSTGLYLLMGWMIILVAEPFFANTPKICLYWLTAGGLFYTVGVIFFVWKRFLHHHLIWHIFVLLGSISHYIAVIYAISSKI